MSSKILLVEDEPMLCEMVSNYLASNGYEVVGIDSYDEALSLAYECKFDIFIFDVKIIGGDGFELLSRLRESGVDTPCIFTTSLNDISDLAKGFKSGCDDYIKKPFDFDILVARLEARLRFGGTNVIKIDDLTIDPDEEKITYQGTEIELKGKPFEVLTHLARHSDQIVSKEQLLDAIWEEPELVTPNVIEVAINQIRQKMDKPLNISTIETVRRRGYRFCFPKKA